MKKFVKVLALGLSLSLSFSALSTSLLANDNNISYASEQRLDLGYPTKGAKFREDVIKLNQNEALKNEVLKQIKNLRAMAWDEDIYYTYEEDNSNNERLRDIAFNAGLRNKEEYVNAIEWNTELERYAIQLSYECIVTDFSYYRADGSDPNTLIEAMTGYYGKNLGAYNPKTINPEIAFGIWSTDQLEEYNGWSQYELLKEYKGVFDQYTQDIHYILDPLMGYVGYGQVYDKDSQSGYANVVLANVMAASSTHTTNLVGNYKLFVGDPNKKAVTASQEKALRSAISNAEMTISTVYDIMDNYPKTVAKVADKLYLQIDKANDLILRAKAALGDYQDFDYQ